MVMEILIPHDAGRFAAPPQVLGAPPIARRVGRSGRRSAARQQPPRGQSLRARLVLRWSAVAMRLRPPFVDGLRDDPRSSTSSHGLLQRCETLLRSLAKARLRTLGLRQGDLARIAERFDVQRFTAAATSGRVQALAHLLATMYWRGCSMPAFVLSSPMHPSTGLVRWLSGFTVMDQVDRGRQLFDLLVHEETRIYAHALAIVEQMQRMSCRRGQTGILMLPELLRPDLSLKLKSHDDYHFRNTNQRLRQALDLRGTSPFREVSRLLRF